MGKDRNMSFKIKQSMDFISSYDLSETGPLLNVQTQVNGGRIKGKDFSSKIDDIVYTL